MRQNPPNARFWTWYNNRWVKLTLKPGQTVIHIMKVHREDGWWVRLVAWTYEVNDDFTGIVRTIEIVNMNPDGLQHDIWPDVCPVSQLRADTRIGSDGRMHAVPEWESLHDSHMFIPVVEF